MLAASVMEHAVRHVQVGDDCDRTFLGVACGGMNLATCITKKMQQEDENRDFVLFAC